MGFFALSERFCIATGVWGFLLPMKLEYSRHSCTSQSPRVRSLCLSLAGWHPEECDLYAASDMCGQLPSLNYS